MRGNTLNYLLTVHHKYPNFWWNFQFFGGYCHAQWFPPYSGDRNSQVPSNVNICRKTKVPNDYRSVASNSLICFSHFSDLSNVNICRNTKALSTPIVVQFSHFSDLSHRGIGWLGWFGKRGARINRKVQFPIFTLFRISVRLASCVLCPLEHTSPRWRLEYDFCHLASCETWQVTEGRILLGTCDIRAPEVIWCVHTRL